MEKQDKIWFSKMRTYLVYFGFLMGVIILLIAAYNALHDTIPPTSSVPMPIKLHPQSQGPLNLKFPHRSSWGQFQQDVLLWPLFEGIEDGFFVESGAADGENCSNTVLFELKKNWTGLLIEPNPDNILSILSKKRNAYLFGGCLSPTGKNQAVTFTFGHNHETGGIFAKKERWQKGSIEVASASINTLMDMIGRKTIDFWSLDIEGVEPAVLETTDFQRLEVGVLCIEMDKGEEVNRKIHEHMKKNGFFKIGVTLDEKWTVVDGVFINPKYFEARGLATPTGKFVRG